MHSFKARLAPDDELRLFLSDKDVVEVHLEKRDDTNAAIAYDVVKPQSPVPRM